MATTARDTLAQSLESRLAGDQATAAPGQGAKYSRMQTMVEFAILVPTTPELNLRPTASATTQSVPSKEACRQSRIHVIRRL
jgi:hypothetical protein